MKSEQKQIFENETQTLRKLFIFFTISFLGQTVTSILNAIFLTTYLANTKAAVSSFLIQNLLIIFFDCTSIFVILVIHRRSFGYQDRKPSSVTQNHSSVQIDDDLMSNED